MDMTNAEYGEYVKRKQPRSPLGKDTIKKDEDLNKVAGGDASEVVSDITESVLASCVSALEMCLI